MSKTRKDWLRIKATIPSKWKIFCRSGYTWSFGGYNVVPWVKFGNPNICFGLWVPSSTLRGYGLNPSSICNTNEKTSNNFLK